MARLLDFVLTGMNKQMHIGIVSVDLQTVFDTLDHGALLFFWFPIIGN